MLFNVTILFFFYFPFCLPLTVIFAENKRGKIIAPGSNFVYKINLFYILHALILMYSRKIVPPRTKIYQQKDEATKTDEKLFHLLNP
jgi:hypothetical protein